MPKGSPSDKTRNQRMVFLHFAGVSLDEIAKIYNISRQRVYQILLSSGHDITRIHKNKPYLAKPY